MMRGRPPEILALDVTALPLPPDARPMLRTIADDVRRPPAGVMADPIALRHWLDEIGRRLDRVARITASVEPSAARLARHGIASPRAVMSPGDRPAGLVVETRHRRPR